MHSCNVNIKNAEILNKSGIIIIHTHKNEQDVILKDLKIIEEKKYGISRIIFGTYH